MAKDNSSSEGVGLGGLLFAIFLTLKLTHVIDWSWWWITAPLWIPIGLALALFTIVAIIAAFVED